jgi:hypothetical protein
VDELHPHFCDCDDCLNGGAGVVLPGCGVTYPTPPKTQRRAADGLRRGYDSVTPVGIALEEKLRRDRRGQNKRRRERTAA